MTFCSVEHYLFRSCHGCGGILSWPQESYFCGRFSNPKFATNVRVFLGLTKYYRKFICRYGKIANPLFGLTKKDCKFLWKLIWQGVFVILKKKLMASPVLTRLDFSQLFILDVDWFIRGVGSILSQKFRR